MRRETHRATRVGGAAETLPSVPYLRFGNPAYDPAKAAPTSGERRVDAEFRRTAGAPVLVRQRRRERIAEYGEHREAGKTVEEAAQAVGVKRDTALQYEREWLPAPMRTADGSSLPDNEPAGSTRPSAALPAAGRS